jgi:hypothetical protein
LKIKPLVCKLWQKKFRTGIGNPARSFIIRYTRHISTTNNSVQRGKDRLQEQIIKQDRQTEHTLA